MSEVTEEVFFNSVLENGQVTILLPKTLKSLSGWAFSLDSLVVRLLDEQPARSIGIVSNLCWSYHKNPETGVEKREKNVLKVFLLTPDHRQGFQFGLRWSSINAPSQECSLTFFQIADHDVDPEVVKAQVSGVIFLKKTKA